MPGPVQPRDTLLSRADLEFMLFDWLGVEELLELARFQGHTRDTCDAVIDLSADLAAEKFAPHNRANDVDEPHLDGETIRMIPEVKAAVDALAKCGLLSVSMPAEIGGGSLPRVVSAACHAWFQAANMSTWAYSMLSIANANLIIAHGSREQVETFAKPLAEGRYHGTMCLSESDAGSSLSDLTTRAVPQPDGTYRVDGSKMWISAGEHELGANIVHLVLAKVPGGPPGVKGISLFIVPKYLVEIDGTRGERNDVTLAELNHKMGARGTVNAALVFGEGRYRPLGRAGAIGYLVGELNRGLAYMFHMMNEARIGVGSQAAALGYTGYLKSLEYARSRVQGRLPHRKDPTAPPVPIIQHADVRRMLMLQKCYAEGALALVLYCSRLLDLKDAAGDAVAQRSGQMLEVLTPIAKHWPSQWCLAANDLAIQVLGGAGYTRDHDVEQHYRDNRLNAIHEGTTGIQALDLLGRKVSDDCGAAFAAVCDEIETTITRARERTAGAAALAAQLDVALTRVQEVTHVITTSVDPDRLADATIYLEAVGHVVVAWMWLEQYLAAGADTPLHAGKRAAAEFFFSYELPKVATQLDIMSRADRRMLRLDLAAF